MKKADHARLRAREWPRLATLDGVAVDSARGYRSGRKSERETPETDSTVSTRSAGTFPDLRHFWTAWYRTPHFSAMDAKPPAASMARSTTVVSDSSSKVEAARVIRRNVQPIVAIGQQPIGVIHSDTMQPMVADDKIHQRRQFSERLRRLLVVHHGAPQGRGIVKWFERDLAARHRRRIASYEAYRKWLNGFEMPDQTNLGILCTAYGFNPTYLQTGEGDELAYPMADDGLFLLYRGWGDSDERGHQLIMDAVKTATTLYPKQQPAKQKKRAP